MREQNAQCTEYVVQISAGNSLHFLSRPQAPISRLAPLADSLDLAKSHRPHLHSIYHHSAYPLVYFAPEMPQ